MLYLLASVLARVMTQQQQQQESGSFRPASLSHTPLAVFAMCWASASRSLRRLSSGLGKEPHLFVCLFVCFCTLVCLFVFVNLFVCLFVWKHAAVQGPKRKRKLQQQWASIVCGGC